MDENTPFLNTVLIVLYDAQKRLLLQHRTLDTNRLPGYWAFFGGTIEKNEIPLEAARRETFEELNYKLNSPVHVFEQDFQLDTARGHMWVYIDAFEGDKSALELHEGQGWGWYTAQETKTLKMIEHDRTVINEIDEYLIGLFRINGTTSGRSI